MIFRLLVTSLKATVWELNGTPTELSQGRASKLWTFKFVVHSRLTSNKSILIEFDYMKMSEKNCVIFSFAATRYALACVQLGLFERQMRWFGNFDFYFKEAASAP